MDNEFIFKKTLDLKKKNNKSKAIEIIKLSNSTITFNCVYPEKNHSELISDITDVLSSI